MGTLQSFTPLPQQTFRLLLYNPTHQLANIIQSPIMKQKYRFETKIINDIPLKQLLLKKTQKCRKKLKILIEEQKLIQISHFISIFHHQIIVIRKQNNYQQIKLNEQKTRPKFSQSNEKQEKIYNPFQVESLKLCISLSIHQLKLFHQILNKKQQNLLSSPIKQQVNPSNNNAYFPIFRTSFTNKILSQEGQQIENIHIQQQNSNNIFQNYKRKNINFQQDLRLTVPKILFSHHECPYNPISLVLNNLPLKMIRKIMNLLLFYDTTFIRYPSLEIFFAAVCNSRNIICGPTELQQIVKRIEIEEFPFKQKIQSSFFIEQDSIINLQSSINPLFLSANSKKTFKSEQGKIIYLYCFCKETFEKDFRKYREKTIEKLKDISIEISFFTNILQLLKQLFKNQNKANQIQKINHSVSIKTKIDLINKFKSQKDTVFAVKQQENDKFNSANKEQNFSRTFQEYTSFLPDNKLSKKQSYLSVVKVQNNTKKQIGSSLSLNHFNPPFHSLKKTLSTSHKGEKIIYPMITTVFFFIHEKQKDRYVIQSMSKKIGRQLKNIKIKKVLNFDQLGQKIQHQCFSAIVIKDDSKILQEFFNIVQVHSIEDKIVVIKRSENDTQEVLVKKIMQVNEIGMIKLNRFYMFSHSYRKFIVIGSKPYLKNLISNYPFLMIKEFVDVNLFQEHRKIRQVISRKNQFIISSFPICDICNQQYQGIVKAKIMYYNPYPDNLMCPLDTKQDCLCKQQNTFQPYASNFQKLINRLQTFSFFSTSYPYENKKVWQNSINLLKLFSKIKQKKYLINKLDKFEDQNQILFFCADSWVVEQITMTILKTFSSRYSGIFLCSWMKNRIIFQCIQEVKKIVNFHINSQISIHKGQIPVKISRLIEQSKQIYRKLTYCLQESQNLFDFCEVMLNLMIENLLFRKSLNYAWKSILSLNNHEYPLDCCTLFIVLLLGFRRAGCMSRTDSINNGTFKSLFQFGSESSDSKQTCSVSIDNFKHIPQQKGQDNEGKNKYYQKEGKNHPQNLFSQFKKSQRFQETHTKNQKLFIDQRVEKKQQKFYKLQTPKVYLKLSQFQKSQDQESLRKFFISKNNVFTYIYTTQFLVFQTIDVSQINQIIPNFPQNKEKSIDKILQVKHNSPKSNYPPKLINYRQRRNDSPLNKFSVDQHISKGNRKRNQKLVQDKKNNAESESPLNLAPLISNLFFFNHTKKQKSETQTQREDFVLELKSCRNIQILPSTEDTLLICIQNIQLLNYNLFIPYYRGRQKQKTKKHFILPPFTKLQINTNYKEKNPLGSLKSSLMTYQLKLSPDHQQRFLQKFIQNFLVQQSQYFQELTENQKIQMQTIFDPMLSTLKSQKSNLKMQDTTFYNKKNQQNLIYRNSNAKFSRKIDYKVSQIKFIDERFQLPESDKFFILMNEFKYFSAHCLLIRSLPQSNMTNAYHAILLTRKGLYNEALKVINRSNPFRFSIQEYVRNLKKRLNEYFEDKSKEKERNKKQTQKFMQLKARKMKWKLIYESDSQKFYLKQKNNQDHSFCYNDDSLDVVYKQVLTNIQHGIQNKSLDRTINQKGQNKHAMNSCSFSGNISNLKGPFRKQKKQSSIAINIEQSSDSQKISEQSQKMNRNSSQKVPLETNKNDLKSKELLQNSEKVEQFPKNEQSVNINGRRSSRISLCSSDFMFGNIHSFNKESSQKLSEKNVTRVSHEKNNMNNKISNSLISNDQIDQIRSSVSSGSESSEQEIQMIRHRNKKSTSIQVKTRYKSNFFRQNAQQMKKYVEIFRKCQYQVKSQIVVTEKCLQESSNILSKQSLDISYPRELQNKQRKQKQEGLNSMQDKVKDEDVLNTQIKQNQEIRSPLKMFKNFRTQNKLEQKELAPKIQRKVCQSPIKMDQIMQKNVENNFENNIENNVDSEISNLVDKNLSGSFLIKRQIKNIGQQQLKRSKNNMNQSDNQQENGQGQFQIGFQLFQTQNLQDSYNHVLQSSDMFGDQDKSKISLNIQSNQLNSHRNQFDIQSNQLNSHRNQFDIHRNQLNIQKNSFDTKNHSKKSKIKCKFTLQLSSESQSDQNTDIINKKQTNFQEMHSIDSSLIQSKNEIIEDHQYQNVIEKMFKDKQQNPKIMDEKNIKQNVKNIKQNVKNIKSPYKIFYKDLQSSESSSQSHNQLQLSQKNNKRQDTIFQIIPKSPLNSNQDSTIKNEQQKVWNKKNQQIVCQQNKKDKTLFNFTFKKKNLQNKEIQSKQKSIENQTLPKSVINQEKQKFIVPKQNRNLIRKSKNISKQDKNTFTFMKPVQQNSDQQIHTGQNQQNMGLQKQQIQQFHTKLMNNSFIFYNYKQVPSSLVSQLDLKTKLSIKKDMNCSTKKDMKLSNKKDMNVSTKKDRNRESFENTDQQYQKDQQMRKDIDEYKVYPQEMIESQKVRNKQFQEQVKRQTITSKGARTSNMIDYDSLKKLKLNCDIRRKR